MRPKSARVLRIESQMQRALAELIAREVRDPRVGAITITAVELGTDLAEARVFFLPFGGRAAGTEVMDGLTRAAGFLRGEVGRRLSLRHAPRLTFVLDEQFERAERLSLLIDRAARHDEALARGREAASDPPPPSPTTEPTSEPGATPAATGRSADPPAGS